MDSKKQLDQLKEAKLLAMHNHPEQMLPKVLETTDTLLVNAFNNNDSNSTTESSECIDLARFFSQLFSDILNHKEISTSELPFIAAKHIDTLSMVCHRSKDPITLQITILTFSGIYPLLVDLVAKTSNDKLWDKLQKFKKFITTKWKSYTVNGDSSNDDLINDARHIGCKLAIVKFISQCIIVQTNRPQDLAPPSSSSSIQNNPHGNYLYTINLSSIPDNHPVISNKSGLEAESKVLLGLLISYLIDEPMMISSVFIGIINCLAFIMKERPQTMTRILTGLLKFNVDAKYQLDNISTINYKLSKRYVERCYKNFVQFGTKNDLIKNNGSSGPLCSKLTKISQTLHIIGEESKSKGILNFDQNQVENKIQAPEREKIMSYRSKIKQKYFANRSMNDNSSSGVTSSGSSGSNSSGSINSNSTNSTNSVTPLDSNTLTLLKNLQQYTMSKNNITKFFNTSPVATNNSYGSVFSLMNSGDSQQDLSQYPQEILAKLATEAIFRASTTNLISGLSVVASRYTDLMSKTTNNSTGNNDNKRKLDNDEITNGHDMKRPKTEDDINNNIKTEKFPSDDNELEVDELDENVNGDFDIVKFLGKPQPISDDHKLEMAKRIIKKIMNIKDNTFSPQLTSSKLESPLEKVKLLDWNNKESWYHILIRLATRGTTDSPEISDLIRSELLSYILTDFQSTISIVIEWLNEEWYSTYILKLGDPDVNNYTKWSLKVLEDLVPFMENQHRRIFIRLMSELPRLEQAHFDKTKSILLDPGRSALGFQTLKFLIMFRAPVKNSIKNLLEQVMQDDPSLQEQVQPILDKYYTSST
ncbi:similar to Saccharomyces cerevisiae YAL043C PTA1 Subunit of holo-CPF, a multiprotein complex and functional homolog of mammalian CPSF [Maudiozyma barnettii]|uniref:Similar to Saccharomyces cerevisiae YAL043C PTA1 Subunit of holo-CPF n=1 Tax=Maudiozyma barnettii TaxID=61262 RepID=A0A8H2VGV0_9SACH|nr:RNA-processing protein PTA1 [Kazachstania barnettii]CAB4255335.1 similar to Saccharomyces cerevisiae YAL043C PTA1 Subunit of holo-CPF [Kazachstania barnettii]CAD1783741.1 similar to Saccharomyces cerevisiae YAL043C PTA1 Subunit of holo-CPF, a multiprotein complex and functional homolog of mammalian CPSF [Kazachstania barnettii]